MLRREQIERLKERYPAGTVVRLGQMEGEHQMPSGMEGKVTGVMKIVPKCSPEDSRSSVTSASVRMPESLPQTTAGIITIPYSSSTYPSPYTVSNA